MAMTRIMDTPAIMGTAPRPQPPAPNLAVTGIELGESPVDGAVVEWAPLAGGAAAHACFVGSGRGRRTMVLTTYAARLLDRGAQVVYVHGDAFNDDVHTKLVQAVQQHGGQGMYYRQRTTARMAVPTWDRATDLLLCQAGAPGFDHYAYHHALVEQIINARLAAPASWTRPCVLILDQVTQNIAQWEALWTRMLLHGPRINLHVWVTLQAPQQALDGRFPALRALWGAASFVMLVGLHAPNVPAPNAAADTWGWTYLRSLGFFQPAAAVARAHAPQPIVVPLPPPPPAPWWHRKRTPQPEPLPPPSPPPDLPFRYAAAIERWTAGALTDSPAPQRRDTALAYVRNHGAYPVIVALNALDNWWFGV